MRRASVMNQPLATKKELNNLCDNVTNALTALRDGLARIQPTEESVLYEDMVEYVSNYVDDWGTRLHTFLGSFEEDI